MKRSSSAALLLITLASFGDKMPVGPPWKTNFREARRAALRSGKPIFVYCTKTY